MPSQPEPSSPNFAFLAHHGELFVRLATLAEMHVHADPNSSLIKQRQFTEAIALRLAASAGLQFTRYDKFTDVLRALRNAEILSGPVLDKFHTVRKAGNRAAHELSDLDAEACHLLKSVHDVAVWFHRTVADPNFESPSFNPPPQEAEAVPVETPEMPSIREWIAEQRSNSPEAASATHEELALPSSRAEAEEELEVGSLLLFSAPAQDRDEFESKNAEIAVLAQADPANRALLIRSAALAEARFAEEEQPEGGAPPEGSLAASDRHLEALQIIRALRAEADASAKDGGSSSEVIRGVRVSSYHEKTIYSFRPIFAPGLNAEASITLEIHGHTPIRGHIITAEESEVLVDLEEDVGDSIPRATIRSDASFVPKQMAARIEESLNAPPANMSIIDGLFGGIVSSRPVAKVAEGAADESNPGQRAAVTLCLGNSLFFVWGPPGTGKTRVLGDTVAQLANRAESVLVLATSNAAVDGAMLRIRDHMKGLRLLESGKVLRIGVPSSKEAREATELSPEHWIEHHYPELVERKRTAVAEQKRLVSALRSTNETKGAELQRRLNEVRAELQSVQASLREAQAQLVASASVVGCTLARLAVDSIVWERDFDAVCIDEASMASFAFVFGASLHARKRMLFFGDFRQLSAICVSRSNDVRMWLANDAFHFSGVEDALLKRGSHPAATMLTEQYRMRPAISNTVSDLAYNGRLTTAPERAASSKALRHPGPGDRSEIVVLDTSAVATACSRDAGVRSGSRRNLFQAIAALAVAHDLSSGGSDARIIAPYRAQTVLSRRLLDDFLGGRPVTATTVHKSQGGEGTAIVFDLVDAFPESSASNLTGKSPETALRLMNVAVSRAREKCVIVADLDFVSSVHPETSPAKALVELARAHGVVIPAEEYLLSISTDWLRFHSWSSAQARIAEDLRTATSTPIQIIVPRGFKLTGQLRSAIAEASTRAAMTVFCDTDLATELEATNADLRLQEVDEGFTVVCSGLMWVGGTRESIVARLGADAPRTLLSPGVRKAISRRLASPELSAQLEQSGGRCEICETRRIVRGIRGLLFAVCPADDDHNPVQLPAEVTTAILDGFGVTCPQCGGRAVARSSPLGFRYSCARDQKCGDHLPEIDDILP